MSSRRERLARHATHTAIAAITIDWLYTCCYWLILGRNERRLKRHPALRYFGIIGQLSVEIAAILHLLKLARKT